MIREISRGLSATPGGEEERYATAFRALGDPTRLRIFEFLAGCCGPVALEETGEVRRVEGATVGEVCCRVTGAERITSTISHHLRELRLAGLITTERRGRHILCRLNEDVVASLASYLAGAASGEGNDECCG
jgi:ArsR family transcriptional regulator, arsenate/arsenite/antimonite-responsive transcriptional repressor